MTDIKMLIGQQIKAARKAKGMTQDELGMKLGVGKTVVSGYEAGKQNLTIGTLQKISEALEMSLRVIIE